MYGEKNGNAKNVGVDGSVIGAIREVHDGFS